MTNLIRSNFQAHPFHLVSPSPWPIFTCATLLALTTSGVLTMHGFASSQDFFYIALVLLISSMSFWFRDVISEATYLGNHTLAVQRGLNMGIALFIVSEALFFLAIFWTFFHSALSPAVEMGAQWPPSGIDSVNPFELPLLNTVILLSSGFTVTYAHHSLIQGYRKGGLYGTVFTVGLALIFTALSSFFTALSSFFTLNSPPKPHAFVSLPLQSGLFFKGLITFPDVAAVCSCVISTLYPTVFILVCGLIVVLSISILLTTRLDKLVNKKDVTPEYSKKGKINRDSTEPTVVNIAYTESQTPTGLDSFFLHDTLDRSGANLKALYTGSTYVLVDKDIDGFRVRGFNMRRTNTSSLSGTNFSEITYTNGSNRFFGMWVPKPHSYNIETTNSRITSKYVPVIISHTGRDIFVKK